jgi:putative nucleotidyltransferase with HDIG domain
LKHRALKEIVSQIDSLPTLPAIYVELVDELESEDASIEKIGDVISKDIGLTVKILKMVNSSFFGLRQQITSPAKAVSLLGLDLIKAIVLTHGTFDKFKNLKYPGLSLEKMWEHAMITGALAKIIAKEGGQDRKASDTAFMAGLLHDIGRLLIAAYLPDSYRVIAKRIEEKSIPMAEAETEIIGTTHAAVGAYLIGLWGLPDAILEAAAFHHAPGQSRAKDLNTATIVHLANAFANRGQAVRQPGDHFEELDYAYLEEANILPNLEDFWAACADHLVVEEPA